MWKNILRALNIHRYALRRSQKRQAMEFALDFMKHSGSPGSYCEFGVYQGVSFYRFHYLSKRFGLENVHMYAFDSFQGLPQPSPAESNVWRAGQYSFAEADFRCVLKLLGVPASRYSIVSGFYEQSLTPEVAERVGPASFVYIDCDLYTSATQVLSFITPLLQSGTLLYFDDFYCLQANPKLGERRALGEWLTVNPSFVLTEWWNVGYKGKFFIVNRK